MGTIVKTDLTHGYLQPSFFRWVRTGDEVIIKEDGDVFIVDRLKVRFSFLNQTAVCL
jgi:acyl-CoA synthetase (AMP-forming)/AMP-acid ligase II